MKEKELREHDQSEIRKKYKLSKRPGCYNCIRFYETKQCPIVLGTFFDCNLGPDYPDQWQYDKNGKLTCTEFVEK